MPTIKFKNQPIEINEGFPQVGDSCPDFKLVAGDLSEVSLADFAGKKVIFNIFPSVDTAVCALQMKSFSQKVAQMDDVILLSASLDLPFALTRFCAAEGIENAVSTSDFRHHSLQKFGVTMQSGPLTGLYARAVLVLNEKQQVVHAELVSDVVNEPDYEAVLDII